MAKNGPAGWIAEAQRYADADGVPVRFGVGDEEYGTYFGLPGLGCYSHLVDLVAPREAGQIKSRLIPKLLAALNAEPEKVMFPVGANR